MKARQRGEAAMHRILRLWQQNNRYYYRRFPL